MTPTARLNRAWSSRSRQRSCTRGAASSSSRTRSPSPTTAMRRSAIAGEDGIAAASARLKLPGVGVMRLKIEPVTAQAFAPFGDLLPPGAGDGPQQLIDELQNGRASARPRLSMTTVEPKALPLTAAKMERHVHSSQAFVPMDCANYLVMVAPKARTESPTLRACAPSACRATRGSITAPTPGTIRSRRSSAPAASPSSPSSTEPPATRNGPICLSRSWSTRSRRFQTGLSFVTDEGSISAR